MKLEGRVALITGAGSGIGRATARLFAREGAKVLVVDINEAAGLETVRLIGDEGGEVFWVKADVSRSEEVRNMVEQAVSRFGRLDILYNNAGITLLKNIVDTEEEEWDRIIDTNLKSVYLGCKFAIPHMIEAGGGVIINTASTSGLHGYEANSAYSASKGGLVALTRCMALDFGPQNIRVNCICPSIIETNIVPLPDDENIRRKIKKAFGGQYPLGRIGQPEEVAQTALFLASDASAWITGIALPIDGGALAGKKRDPDFWQKVLSPEN